MSKTTDKTEIILPLINKALETAGQPPAEVIQGDYGMPCLRLPADERLRIRQLGELTMAMLPMLKEDGNPGKGIIWCQYVGDSLAEELSRRGFCYADTAGNMLLRFNGNFLQIRNRPKPKEIAKERARGRCLSPSGLEVLFLLLTEPDAVKWNYRDIAASSGTTVGTVNYTMADLRAKRHLIEDGAGRRLADIRTLSRLWVDNYRLRLLPKLKTTRYSGELTVIDGRDDLIGGGETAAMKAGLLTTGNVLLWNQGTGIARTIVKNHWHLDPNGNIEVRDAFWPTEKRRFAEHAPWLLVYADLLATEDGRCLEIAEEIRKCHLEGLA